MRYQNGDISIDDSFARFGSKSYAIDKINSVEIKQVKAGGCSYLITGIICAAAALLAFGAFGSGQSGLGIFMVIMVLLFGMLTITAYAGAQVITYTIMLTTSSSEAQATQSTELAEIQKMRDAIEGAMVQR